MVTEEDLISTVSTAYANGWRQVKLYFMCGLPTETDEDVLAIARVAHRVIEAGREASGRRDIRCTVSIGGFVPKPHTPFQWAAQCDHETVDARLKALGGGDAGRPRLRVSRSGSATTTASRRWSRGCCRAATAGSAKVIRAVWADGGRFDGWSEYFSFDRWERCAAERAGRRRRRPGLVHHAGARVRRDPALGPPRRRARQGLAVAGLAGGDRPCGRRRGRGLPVDAVLRVRGLPGDGHRDRGRPDRRQAAAADRARQQRPAPPPRAEHGQARAPPRAAACADRSAPDDQVR